MSLEDAQRELERNPPPPMNLTAHPQSLRALGELLDQRDQQQGDEAESAA